MEMQTRDVFNKVLKDAIKNIIFYGIGTVVIVFIGNTLHLRFLGIIIAGIFTFIILLSLVPFLISFVADLIGIPLAIFERIKGNRNALKEKSYLTAGTIVLFIENAVCLLYVFYLYKTFF